MSNNPKKTLTRKDLTSGSLLGNLLRLAAPVAAGALLQSLYQMVDRYWLGQMGQEAGKEALAAVTAAGPFMFLTWAIVMGFGTAGTALVSQHTGAGDHEEAARSAGQTLVFLTVLALCLCLPLAVFAPGLFRFFSVPSQVLGQSTLYMRLVMIGAPFLMFHMAYASVLRGLGDTVTPLLIVTVSNVLNILLDPVLINGMWGVPAMGVAGAAGATAFSQMVAAALTVWAIRRHRAGLVLQAEHLVPHAPTIRQIIGIGAPAAVNMSSNSVGFVLFQWMVNIMGPAVMGAFGLSFTVLHFFGIPGFCMAAAAAPVVGQALGAAKPALARRAVLVSVAIVAAVMVAPVVFLTGWGASLAQFFTDDADVVAEAAKFFKIVPISMYFFIVVMVLTAAFNGSGHTRPPMMVTFLRWLIRLPVAYVLAFPQAGHGEWLGALGQSMGSTGIYLAMVIANIICAGVLVWLFRKGDWQEPAVRGLGLQVRPYRSADRRGVLKLLPREADLQDCLGARDEPDGEFLVGEVYGDVIAMGVLRPAGGQTAEVVHLRVHPEFQRKGYARSMLRKLEAHAAERALPHLHLYLTARQEAALQLARNTGYTETAREPAGETERVRMDKDLDAAGEPPAHTTATEDGQ